jgi:hypothetical protein
MGECVDPLIHRMFVYYESINRELKIRTMYECRCDERLQTKVKEFTLLTYTGFLRGVMKDYKLKLRNLHSSHTLGSSGDWNT